MTCAELANIVFHQFTGFRFKCKNAVILIFHKNRHSVCEQRPGDANVLLLTAYFMKKICVAVISTST